MAPRVSPSQRLRAEIDEVFGRQGDLPQALEEVTRLSVRLMLQAALEAEVTEFLGRDRYQRGEREREGYRNGYQPLTIRSTAGPIVLERPKLRGTAEAFASRLLGVAVTRTNALEALVISSFVRGLSVRDVEQVLEEALGPEAGISRSTVSRICQAIKEEFDAWRTRDLSGVELDVLFLDASHFRYHPGAKAEPVLCAWGLTSEGKPLLIGLEGAGSESTDAWEGFLSGLVGRGLRPPLLVVSDGGAGLISAIELCFPKALRQRCLVHRARNLLARVPTHAQEQVKREFWAIFNDLEAAPGEPAVAEARLRARRFSAKWRKLYPGMVASFEEDQEALFAHLRLPRAYWARCRHSNLIERSFGETRRRVKVIGRLPGEQSCLSLCWAVLDRASKGWRGIEQTLAMIRLLHELRRELYGEEAMREEEEVVVETENDVTPAA